MTIGKRSLPCSNVGLPDVLFNVCLIVACTISLQSYASDLEIPWPMAGTELGNGYDIDTSEFKSSRCVKTTPSPQSRARGHQLQRFDISDVRSSTQLLEKMSTVQSGGLSVRALRASSRQSFIEQVSSSSKRATIVIALQIVGRQETVGTTSGFDEHVGTGSSFRATCGTHFVSSITYGGEFLLALSKYLQRTERDITFYQNVRGAFAGWSAGQETSYSKKLLTIQSEIQVVGSKSGTSSPNVYTLAEAIAAYKSFPKEIEKQGTTLRVTVSPYTKPPFDASRNAEELAKAALSLGRYEMLDARSTRIVEKPKQFDIAPSTMAEFDSFRTWIHAKTASLTATLKKCASESADAGGSAPSCKQLSGYPTIPPDAEADMPRGFGIICEDYRTLQFDPIFLNSVRFIPRADSDMKIGPNTALFDIDLKAVRRDYPPATLISGKVTMRQNGGPQRDVHVATLRPTLMNHNAIGCAVPPDSWVDLITQQIGFPLEEFGDVVGNDQYSFYPKNESGRLVERMNCWINPPRGYRMPAGFGGRVGEAASTQRPRCTVYFKPIPRISLLPID